MKDQYIAERLFGIIGHDDHTRPKHIKSKDFHGAYIDDYDAKGPHPRIVWTDSDGEHVHYLCNCQYMKGSDSLPDFSTKEGTVTLLELMMKRDDYDEFLVEHGALSKYGRHLDCILVDYITNPGALRDAVYEWLKGRE